MSVGGGRSTQQFSRSDSWEEVEIVAGTRTCIRAFGFESFRLIMYRDSGVQLHV